MALDRQRLGKQRVETMQILHTLEGRSSGWQHHPAVVMWRGYEPQLFVYGLEVCTVWRRQGYDDTVLDKLLVLAEEHGITPDLDHLPGWVTPELCRSHQSNLLRKNPQWYRPLFGWEVPDDLEYVWPQAHSAIRS